MVRDGLTRESGFLSLVQARDAVRALPMEHRCQGVTVTILSGSYSVHAGHGELQLDERDSGCEGAPVVYRGEQTTVGRPTLHAGVKIPPSAFQSTTVDGVAMFRADVRPYGVSDFGEFVHTTSTGMCATEKRSAVYYQRQPQTLARHPNIDRATGNFRWMRVGQVSSYKTFASSKANDTIAARRWMNDTTGDIMLHGFWTWDWADSFQRVARILPPPGGSGTNIYTTSWGAVETVPTVAACNSKRSVLSPAQQQWNFSSRYVTTADNTTALIENILVNTYAPSTLPVWAGGTGTPSYPGPVLFNCQKQLIFSGAVLPPGSKPPNPECTNLSASAYGQWQLILNASSGQLKTGIPTDAPGRRLSYGFGAYSCASADHLGNVALAPCVQPVPPHQSWRYDPGTLHLQVGGLAPPPPTHPAAPGQQTIATATIAQTNEDEELCLTLAPHTVSYELETTQVGEQVRATSYNLTTGSRYYALNALGMLDQQGEYYFEKASGFLYFLPPQGGRVSGAELGVGLEPPSEAVYISVNATVRVSFLHLHACVQARIELSKPRNINGALL